MSVSYKESLNHNELHSYEKVTEEYKKMAQTLKTEAEAYQPPQPMQNAADLEKFPIDLELKDGKGTSKEDGEEFTYKYFELDGIRYRVAGSIIGGIKALLTKMPDLKYVSVIKQGEGKNTRYQVIPSTEGQAQPTEGPASPQPIEEVKL